MHHPLLIQLILPLILPAIATNSPSDSRTCYLMNGSVAPALSPCRPPSNTSSNDQPQTATHSACCRLRNTTTSSSSPSDDLSPAICLEPSGLCLSRNGLMYISGCTDATWKDPACPSMCPDKRTQFKGKALEDKHWSQGKQVDHWQVMVCAPQSICCRRFSNNDDCCGNKTVRVDGVDVGGPKVGWWDYNGDGGNNDSGSGNGNATGTGAGSRPTGCQSESGKAGDGENDAEQCEPCHEATVGAAVGAPLGAAFVATLAALAWAIRRQKVAEKRLVGVQAQASMMSSEYYKPPGVRQVQKPGNHAELSAMRQYELDGGTSTQR